MSKKSLLTLFLLVVGLFVLARPIPAQTSAGNITGIITDQSMAVLPSAKLTVKINAEASSWQSSLGDLSSRTPSVLPS